MERIKMVKLENIQKWSKYFLDQKLKPEDPITPGLNENLYGVDTHMNDQVSLYQGDITELEVDAIVNAANDSLLGGGGIDGAIHKAAGPDLVKDCAKLNGCDAGEAKFTSGFNLPAKYIIHTVGPRNVERRKLADCYRNSLNILKGNNLETISFPCIATGIFGYPNEDAAHVALLETRNFLLDNPQIKRVVFCTFLQKDTKIYEELMQRYFPMIDNSLSIEERKANLKATMNPAEYEKITKKQT